MDIVRTIIHPHHNESVADDTIPQAVLWLANMDPLYKIFLALSCTFVAVVVILACVHLYFVLKYVSNERIQTDLYYLVFMYPITTLCGLVGMFIPRAAAFLYAVALVYFMFCLFIMVTLLFNIFGSRKEMSAYLLQRGIKISFRVPPLCCCKFLPRIDSTDKNLRRIEWLVFQTPIIRTCLELANVVVFMELSHRRNLWFVFSQTAGLTSMFLAFYGCYVMVPLGREKHAPYRFDFLFRTVDIAQCIYTIQKFLFDFAGTFEIVKPDRVLPAAAKAQWWASFMVTWEMLLLSALTTYCLRPSKSLLFDKYPVVDSTSRHHALRSEGPQSAPTSVNGSTETIASELRAKDQDVRIDGSFDTI